MISGRLSDREILLMKIQDFEKNKVANHPEKKTESINHQLAETRK